MPAARAEGLDENGYCRRCEQRHVPAHGGRPCQSHVWFDRASYVPGQPRKRLDKPVPCRANAARGQNVCPMHGAKNPHARQAAEQRVREEKVRRALGDAGDPVTDPIAKLCAIAGRAVAFMESLGQRVDELAADDVDRAEARADIAIYGRSIKDAAQVVESIIRMGIAERLAKQDGDRTAAWVSFIDGVLSELGHNPRDPQVAGVVLRMLEQAS